MKLAIVTAFQGQLRIQKMSGDILPLQQGTLIETGDSIVSDDMEATFRVRYAATGDEVSYKVPHFFKGAMETSTSLEDDMVILATPQSMKTNSSAEFHVPSHDLPPSSYHSCRGDCFVDRSGAETDIISELRDAVFVNTIVTRDPYEIHFELIDAPDLPNIPTTYGVTIDPLPLLSNDTTPTLTGTGEAGSTLILKDANGVEVGSSIVGADGTYAITTTTLSEGAQTLTITATDTAGNIATAHVNFTLDAHTTVTIDPLPLLSNDTTPTLTGTGEAGSTLILKDANGTIVGSGIVGADGTYAITTTTLSEGAQTLTITATDTAGNIATVTQNLLVDTRAVALSDTATTQEDVTTTASGNVMSNDESNSTITAQTTTGTYGTLTLNSDGTYTYVLHNTAENVQNLTAGQIVHDTFTYTLTDTVGNTTTATLDVSVQGQDEAPIITTVATNVIEDTAHVIATVSDSDGTIVNASGTAMHGSVSIDASGHVLYTPNTNYSGSDSVTLSVTDNDGVTTTQTLAVGITAVADAPILSGDFVNGQTINVHVALTDTSETLSALILSGVPEGVSLSEGIRNSDGTWSLPAYSGDHLVTLMGDPGVSGWDISATSVDGIESASTHVHVNIPTFHEGVWIDPITADDTISPYESTQTITITGEAHGATVHEGDVVLTIINGNYYTSTVDGHGIWSVDVLGEDLARDTHFSVDVYSGWDDEGNPILSTGSSDHSVAFNYVAGNIDYTHLSDAAILSHYTGNDPLSLDDVFKLTDDTSVLILPKEDAAMINHFDTSGWTSHDPVVNQTFIDYAYDKGNDHLMIKVEQDVLHSTNLA